MTNRYTQAMDELESEKEAYFRQREEIIPQSPTPTQTQTQTPTYIDEVAETFNSEDVTQKHYTENKRRNPRRIQANCLKGGSGAKWIIHTKILKLIQKNYTRKQICEEIDICRMTLWRHLNIY